MTKQEIRKIYLRKRLDLQDDEFDQLNRKICERFFSSSDLFPVSVLHSFLPIEKNREVNTWLILDRIKKEFPKIRISVPRINNQTSQIESFYYEDIHQLERNTWGIMEPKHGLPAPASKIDIALVPLLAFDRRGNRVGYGRGFYDKFLLDCSPGCMKIGLSLFPAVDSIDDLQSYDLPLNKVITPFETVTI